MNAPADPLDFDRRQTKGRTPIIATVPDTHLNPWQDIAFEVLLPVRQRLPLVVASPHSGRFYSDHFLRQSRLRLAALRRSEDSFVDHLVAAAPSLGIPMIRALFPRTVVDVNREPFELDPDMFVGALPGYVNSASPRVRSGLGTIPRVAASGAEIYGVPLSVDEGRRRIKSLYLPYHRALKRLIKETKARFGVAILIDCHSMPSQAALAGHGGNVDRRPRRHGGTGFDIVLGDRHGAACAPDLSIRAEEVLSDLGYVVSKNYPYAGGFTTKRYGRPVASVHALQIEINRALYLDEGRLDLLPTYDGLAADLNQFFLALADMGTAKLAAE